MAAGVELYRADGGQIQDPSRGASPPSPTYLVGLVMTWPGYGLGAAFRSRSHSLVHPEIEYMPCPVWSRTRGVEVCRASPKQLSECLVCVVQPTSKAGRLVVSSNLGTNYQTNSTHISGGPIPLSVVPGRLALVNRNVHAGRSRGVAERMCPLVEIARSNMATHIHGEIASLNCGDSVLALPLIVDLATIGRGHEAK